MFLPNSTQGVFFHSHSNVTIYTCQYNLMSFTVSTVEIHPDRKTCVWNGLEETWSLTWVRLLPSSAGCWHLCGSRRHSSCPPLVWGPVMQQFRNLHTPGAASNGQSRGGRPCRCPHRGPPGTPTADENAQTDVKSELDASCLDQGPCCDVDIYLRRHHFSVGATDFDPCVETSLVVALHDVTSKGIICSHPTVVWSWMGMTLMQACYHKIIRSKNTQKYIIS